MKQNIRLKILSLLIACVLLLPAAACVTVAASSQTGSMVSYAVSLQKLLQYQSNFTNAASASDYYAIASGPAFQQTVSDLTVAYYTLQSGGWISVSYAEGVAFQQAVQNLLSRINALQSSSSATYAAESTASGFLQAVINFIDSYGRLPSSLSGGTYTGSSTSLYGPVYALRTGIPATLTTRMATRLGPGTAYSEELGTLPQTTAITVLEQVTANDVPWVMVEYVNNGLRYRAWTGMKRISASQAVPWGSDSPTHATVLKSTEAYYGPGTYYAKHEGSVPAGTPLEVYEAENNFLLCDYYVEDTLIRAYIPWDSRVE